MKAFIPFSFRIFLHPSWGGISTFTSGAIGFFGLTPSGYFIGFSLAVNYVFPFTANSPRYSKSLSIFYSTPSSKFNNDGFESMKDVSTYELKNWGCERTFLTKYLLVFTPLMVNSSRALYNFYAAYLKVLPLAVTLVNKES